MMSGSLAALFSAFFYAVSMICSRRGVLRIKDAALGGYISVFIAPPLFLLAAAVTGDLHSITAFTWKGYVWLAIAGIVHFVLGRSSHYWTLRYLGANMASVFTSLQLVYIVFMGFFILGESVTANSLLGTALIIVGPVLLLWPQRGAASQADDGDSNKPRVTREGVIAGLLTGMFFGTSPLFIKWGLQQGGSALAGTFISYSSATLLFGATMLRRVRREAIVNMERRAMLWFAWSGIFVGMATLFRYIAFKYGSISISGPLVATSPVVLLFLSFILNRKLESFRPNVILGTVLVVLGAIMLYR